MVMINLVCSRSAQIKRETQMVCKRLLFSVGCLVGLVSLVNIGLRFKVQSLQTQVSQLSHLLQQQTVSLAPSSDAMTPFNQMEETFRFYQNRMRHLFQQLTQPDIALCLTDCHQSKNHVLLKGYAFSPTQVLPLFRIAHLMALQQSTTEDRVWFQWSIESRAAVGDEGK